MEYFPRTCRERPAVVCWRVAAQMMRRSAAIVSVAMKRWLPMAYIPNLQQAGLNVSSNNAISEQREEKAGVKSRAGKRGRIFLS